MHDQYLNEKRRIEHHAAGLSLAANVATYRKFALFTTNLGMALPEIPVRRHLPLFRKAIANRQLCFLDERYHDAIPWHWHGGHRLDFDGLRQRPAVIGTFHVGSYRFINHLLAKNGVPITLLVSDTVRERQAALFKQQCQALGIHHDACSLISADHPMAGLQIMRALSAGRTLVGYLDGNKGSANQQNVHQLPFLDTTINVRIGLAQLAIRAGVPFHGILALRKPDGALSLWQNRSFHFRRKHDQLQSAISVTEAMYADLAATLQDEPWQWDHWYYLHEAFLEEAMG